MFFNFRCLKQKLSISSSIVMIVLNTNCIKSFSNRSCRLVCCKYSFAWCTNCFGILDQLFFVLTSSIIYSSVVKRIQLGLLLLLLSFNDIFRIH